MRQRTSATAAALALVAALALQLAAPAAAACQNTVGGACTYSASNAQSDCCAGKTCHPVLKQCYPSPRTLGQPCLDQDGYDCGANLACDPVWKRCMPSPGKEKQPCIKHSDCSSGLYCNDYTRRCQAPNAANTKNCHASLPCGAGYSCDTIRNQCFVAPRTADTPCVGREMNNPAVPNWGCAAGTSCERVISWECQPFPGLQKACHDFLPCQAGLSCHPYIQKARYTGFGSFCFNEPRLLNQPCGIVTVGGQQRTFDCDFDAGLTCDISVGRCVAAAKENQSCYTNRPCGDGLSCHPGQQICLRVPRLEGMPCVDDGTDDTIDFKCADSNSIGEPLTCDMLVTKRCIKAQTYAKTSNVAGAHCYEGRPCIDGLTCSTSDQKCYNYPRIAGEPCIPNAGADSLEKCGPGLVCRPDTKKCEAPRLMGELCFPGFPCASGFSCVNAFRQCARASQLAGEYCDPAVGPSECSAGLSCSAQWPYCVRSA
ncbi:hypothetical protein COHA_002116 [Chlorella ohadii]|uniref:Dickkopf N-terminal cysteine-rich domain-containing protein n=1 Tax=Chlorella ohadii TaxID=2649997 RepID=A0AAD5DXQ4_9CHLO|nr:hypothetical protein COHA_002116 [Chlorella ohadii]